MQILQITDMHLYGSAGVSLRGVDTDSSLRRVLEEAGARDTDYAAILATGDLVQDDPTGYLRFKSVLGNLGKPVFCLPGNHDEPDAMRQSLASPPFHYCGTHEIGGWQLIMLDSYDPGHVGGRFSPSELARLDGALRRSDRPTLICMHHHPVPMGSRWLDTIGVANADEFWSVVDGHTHVRGVAWGHVHQAYDGERGGVRLLGTPSTGAQFEPHSDRYALDDAPPAFRRIELAADGTIRSEVTWIRDLKPGRQAAAR